MATRNVEVVATLATNTTPIGNKTISFKHKLSTDTMWTDDGTAMTDPTTGDASKMIEGLEVPNTYDFWAGFSGDNDYESCEATYPNFRLKAVTTISLQINPE